MVSTGVSIVDYPYYYKPNDNTNNNDNNDNTNQQQQPPPNTAGNLLDEAYNFPSIHFLRSVIEAPSNSILTNTLGTRSILPTILPTILSTITTTEQQQQSTDSNNDNTVVYELYQYRVQKSLLQKYDMEYTNWIQTKLFRHEKITSSNHNNTTTTTTTTNNNNDNNTTFRDDEESIVKRYTQQRWRNVCQSIILRSNCSTTDFDISSTTNKLGSDTTSDNNDNDNINDDPTVDLSVLQKEFIELVQSNFTRSNNDRILYWSTIHCPSKCQFQLHAHPNIEIILCLYGELHEVRLVSSDPPIPTTTNHKVVPSSGTSSTITTTTTKHKNQQVIRGPNLQSIRQSEWIFTTLPTNHCLINEIGSIHKSFTSTIGTGCLLLCLWSGSHANIANEPPNFPVSDIVDTMDTKITTATTTTSVQQQQQQQYPGTGCCYNNNNNTTFWEQLNETFLPASERSTTTS